MRGLSLAKRGSGIASHVELALIIVRDSKSEPFVETQRRVGLDHAERDGPAGLRGLTDQARHDFCADALALERRVDEQLRQKYCIVVDSALQPSDVGAVQRDDPDLD